MIPHHPIQDPCRPVQAWSRSRVHPRVSNTGGCFWRSSPTSDGGDDSCTLKHATPQRSTSSSTRQLENHPRPPVRLGRVADPAFLAGSRFVRCSSSAAARSTTCLHSWTGFTETLPWSQADLSETEETCCYAVSYLTRPGS